MNEKLKRKQYEMYRLQWMIDHGFTLEDLIQNMQEVYDNEIDPDNGRIFLDEIFDIFENEYGFNQELWACYDEWLDSEFLETRNGVDHE